ncbi:hypothetical protein AAU57_12160 [Nonlabens sp. YIK11]|uniref:hypothetical protein n=1 Tax=Nonlabens sp. YIK11 TaxID=1453349 RepID=UPI0006DC67F5|nr:hypothetical protein [Nonlabens sp. YIK11]KQC34000.1 hypothetical protein AAU57_12160 [Nonlabens sp. YIK11]
MSNTKHHYRSVFKSDHLGSADLEEMVEEGKRLVFTIKEVKQEMGARVAGKKIDANIAYFKEDIKPLVLNATNSKQVAKFAGSKFVEDWSGLTIELYIDASVKMKGEIVGGVRIKPTMPQATKPKLLPNTEQWKKAKDAVMSGKTTPDSIRKHYELSKEHELQLTA